MRSVCVCLSVCEKKGEVCESSFFIWVHWFKAVVWKRHEAESWASVKRLSSVWFFSSWPRGVATTTAEAGAHRKSKQVPHQGCLFSINHNLGTKHNEWPFLSRESLSGLRPAFVWLRAATRYQRPQRKSPATDTHTHTSTWTHTSSVSFSFFVQKRARISDPVYGNHVLLHWHSVCPSLLWFNTSCLYTSLLLLTPPQVGKGRKTW